MAKRTNLLLPDTERWPLDIPVIELRNVSKSFGDMPVIKDLSLTIRTGQTTVIAGESGSGKSVLLRMMNGLTIPDEGEALLFGQDLAKVDEHTRTELRKRCTMVFQSYALIDSLTVAENIGFPLAENTRMPAREIRTLVVDLLEMLELSDAIDLLPASLSGGMKKRVALARAVVTNPEVVLFDEPTTGLDPVMIEFVDSLIQKTQQSYGITSVVISHDMASNRRLADHMAILANGRIAAEGTFTEVAQNQHPDVVELMADAETERMSSTSASTDSSTAESTLNPIVCIRELHKSFGNNHVLKGISFDIPEKKITAVIGGSGSGKSVLIKHIIGLFQPEQGSVEVFGVDLTTCTKTELQSVQARVGMLFQGAALFDSMSVEDNIAFPLVEARKLGKTAIHEKVQNVAEKLSVHDILTRMPDSISNGQKKRVALARALITQPEIMIYDEPTTGQDPVMMRRVDDMIVEAAEKFDITSIVISHDMNSTFRIADQVAMIKHGELVICGPPSALRASDDPRVREFIFAGNPSAARG